MNSSSSPTTVSSSRRSMRNASGQWSRKAPTLGPARKLGNRLACIVFISIKNEDLQSNVNLKTSQIERQASQPTRGRQEQDAKAISTRHRTVERGSTEDLSRAVGLVGILGIQRGASKSPLAKHIDANAPLCAGLNSVAALMDAGWWIMSIQSRCIKQGPPITLSFEHVWRSQAYRKLAFDCRWDNKIQLEEDCDSNHDRHRQSAPTPPRLKSGESRCDGPTLNMSSVRQIFRPQVYERSIRCAMKPVELRSALLSPHSNESRTPDDDDVLVLSVELSASNVSGTAGLKLRVLAIKKLSVSSSRNQLAIPKHH
ncbi:hypothetical protein V8E36_009176 [Tilletia maclaganii]